MSLCGPSRQHARAQATPRRRTDRGAAAVEFALVLPMLLLVVAGIVDLGRAMYTEITLTGAAREGVRVLVTGDASSADAQARAGTAAPGLTGLTVTASTCSGPGADASVTAQTPFTWTLLGPAMSAVGASSTLPSTLSSTAVARCL
jgi:Flp pilus assembly protein TadG